MTFGTLLAIAASLYLCGIGIYTVLGRRMPVTIQRPLGTRPGRPLMGRAAVHAGLWMFAVGVLLLVFALRGGFR